jgi:serine/threonine protein kinase
VPAVQATRDEDQPRPGLGRRLSRKVVPGMPRPGTFKRQQSERRERLMPHEPCPTERRTASMDRRKAASARGTSSSLVPPPPSASAPEVGALTDPPTRAKDDDKCSSTTDLVEIPSFLGDDTDIIPPPLSNIDGFSEPLFSEGTADAMVEAELEWKWILNLSMHFRDHSDREKFFVTYADAPNRRRRITVSCDYRNGPPDSLEQELQKLKYQRDKSARIYEAIRESLPDIQFYDTVTNLKLQTTDGRLHVHVTEDLHEIIPYPPISAISHLRCPRYTESALEFDSHLSGFVYKMRVNGEVYIKKEIPGPDTVEEFLYEINALQYLNGSKSVIHFGGVVVDDNEQFVKGLLISFAEQGALIDLIYDEKDRLSWKRRERWALQIVQGLSEIHEGGFVQGDFTLSNIVIDDNDDAKIIDINRRGCPVGWEPPEVTALIDSGQRIGMYIGVKSDLFQLGMVLWALAEEQDEPEVQPRPLSLRNTTRDIPQYYRDLVSTCLSDRPQDRLSAKELLTRFPAISDADSRPDIQARDIGPSPTERRYIDPAAAVEREDLDRFRELRPEPSDGVDGLVSSRGDTYVDSSCPAEIRVNRSVPGTIPRSNLSIASGIQDTAFNGPGSTGESRDDSEPDAQIVPVSPSDDRKWEVVDIDGNPYLIQRDGLNHKHVGLDPGNPDAIELPGVASAGAPIGPMDGELAGVGSHIVLDERPSQISASI